MLAATAVLSLTFCLLPSAAAQFDPGKQLGAPPKSAGVPLSPARQAEADKLAKERLEAQLKANAERKKAEKARDEAKKNAQSVANKK